MPDPQNGSATTPPGSVDASMNGTIVSGGTFVGYVCAVYQGPPFPPATYSGSGSRRTLLWRLCLLMAKNPSVVVSFKYLVAEFLNCGEAPAVKRC